MNGYLDDWIIGSIKELKDLRLGTRVPTAVVPHKGAGGSYKEQYLYINTSSTIYLDDK